MAMEAIASIHTLLNQGRTKFVIYMFLCSIDKRNCHCKPFFGTSIRWWESVRHSAYGGIILFSSGHEDFKEEQ